MRLATTPCSPLYSKHVSPDRELAALLGSFTPPAKSTPSTAAMRTAAMNGRAAASCWGRIAPRGLAGHPVASKIGCK